MKPGNLFNIHQFISIFNSEIMKSNKSYEQSAMCYKCQSLHVPSISVLRNFTKRELSATVFAIYNLVCQVCFTYPNSSDGVRTKQNTRWWLTFPSPTPTGDNYHFPFTVNTRRMCGLLVIYTRMLSMTICVALIHAFVEQIESLKKNPSYTKVKKKRGMVL
jgi:hypothetical protein